MNSRVHGNGKGIVYDHDQGKGGDRHNHKIHGKQKPWRRILFIPDQIHCQKLVVVSNLLLRNAHQLCHMGCIGKRILHMVKIEIDFLFFSTAFLYDHILYIGKISDGLNLFCVNFTDHTALPSAFLPADSLNLIFPCIIKQAAQQG